MVNELKEMKNLEHLKAEHSDIEDQIKEALRGKVVNQFQIADLKKKKIAVKEQIAQLEARMVDDIVA